MSMDDPPFAPTECACDACVDCCKRPAHMLPRDVPRLVDHLAKTGGYTRLGALARYFRAGAGALIGDKSTGQALHIRTIVPDTDPKNGWCRLFDPATRRCTVHAIAPFGCRYFDTHMTKEEGDPKSLWGLRVIEASNAYAALVWFLDDQPGAARPGEEWFGSPVRRWEQVGVLWWCGCAYARLDDGSFEVRFMCARHEVEHADAR